MRSDDGPLPPALTEIYRILDISIVSKDMDRRTMTKDDILEVLDERRASSTRARHDVRHLKGSRKAIDGASGSIRGTKQGRTKHKSKTMPGGPKKSKGKAGTNEPPQTVYLEFTGNHDFKVFASQINDTYSFPA